MPPDAGNDLPAEPGKLAILIVALEERCNLAMSMLLQLMAGVTREVTGRFSGRYHQELEAQAASFIWPRLKKFDPKKGRFEDWYRTVLYHCCVDEVRKSERGVVLPPIGGEATNAALEPVAEKPIGAETEEMLERLEGLRQALDRVAWEPSSSRGVHYFAVLLLQLRVVVARFLSATPPCEVASTTQAADLIIWCLPWRVKEGDACIKLNWPPMNALWATLRPTFCRPPHWIDAPDLCGLLAPMLPTAERLTPGLWNQWVKRGKEEARRRLGDDDLWERLFGRLLPDR
jgi:hypothetical protein